MTPKRTTLPPVELVCSSMQAARVSHYRIAHNALTVALLASRNAPVIRAPAQVPNVSKVRAVGGKEQQVLDGLLGRLAEARERMKSLTEGTEAHRKQVASVLYLERHITKIRADLEDICTAPSIQPGVPDVLIVRVPPLHVRIVGEEETVSMVSDFWVGQVRVNLDTPRCQEYQHLPPNQLTGAWPLYIQQGDKSGMRRADCAAKWHVELMEQLWPDPLAAMPALYVVGNVEAAIPVTDLPPIAEDSEIR